MRDRTADLLRARQALSQLSYSPVNILLTDILFFNRGKAARILTIRTDSALTKSKEKLVGLGRLELPTSPLSGVRSNQLSYRPLTRFSTPSGRLVKTDRPDVGPATLSGSSFNIIQLIK